MTEPRELVLLSRAQRAIAQARTLDEVKDMRDRAVAVKAYVKKAQLGQQLVVNAAVIRLRAERKIGEMLGSVELADAAPGNQYTGRLDIAAGDRPIFLRDLGISKLDSSRSQKIACVPEELFEKYIADHVDLQREPTSAGLLRLAKQQNGQQATSKTGHVLPASPASVLADILDQGSKFATVFAQPFCVDTDAAGNRTLPSIDEVMAEPVAEVCEDQAHLHLWSTNCMLADAMAIIHAWGFSYRSCLVCLNSEISTGEYWQDSHQFLLLGVRGGLGFLDYTQPSLVECDWPSTGGKPEAIRKLIEKVSPGPYLQLYGDGSVPGASWTVCPWPIGKDLQQ